MDGRFRFEPSPAPMPLAERASILQGPGFGKAFTDHMLVLRHTASGGWQDGVVRARAPFSIDPACAVLHYAQEIFEGMKAYRTIDGPTALFRPAANARRFNASAARMAMPQMPEDMFIAAVSTLAQVEQDWIPSIEVGSLYLRPFMFASEVFLGVRPSAEYIFAIIASPAGAYFKRGSAALSLWVSGHYIRAAPGGTGGAKCGGNYAAGLAAQVEASTAGCDQVLFLDAVERKWVEELGGMNIFFVFADGSIATPPLGGTILPGITRDSLIALARDRGHIVREESYSLDQWRADAHSGELVEAFACGTAAVVQPIGEVRGEDFSFSIGSGEPGGVASTLKSALIDIQHGRADDRHRWVMRLP